ncbi:MAG: hypothetical protein IPK98_19570 [Chloracidobacterium sp.]|nr:hypothetical protein [Chloracidobacterium sp.]
MTQSGLDPRRSGHERRFFKPGPIWSPKGDEPAFFFTKGNVADGKGNRNWCVASLGARRHSKSVRPVADGSFQLRRWAARAERSITSQKASSSHG